MKMLSAARPVPASLVLVLLLAAGCATNRKTAEEAAPAAGTAAATGERAYGKTVHVLVDGKEKGVIPATVRVHRGMGARMVSLWQSGQEIRTYELQTVRTSDAASLSYSFFGEAGDNATVYDVTNLPTAGKNNYVVPYSPYRITIEDRQYQLTLIVED